MAGMLRSCQPLMAAMWFAVKTALPARLGDPLGLLLGVDGGEVFVSQPCRATAVDDELRTRRITRLVAGQVDHQTGYFAGLRRATQRGLEDVVGHPIGHRRLDQPRMDRI